MPRKLTEKQEAFVRAYITNGGQGIEAYKSAYDTARMSDDSIRKEANRLLNHPLIAPRIVELGGEFAAKVQQELEISPESLLRELATIVKTGKTMAGRAVKTNEQINAMSILGRFLGMDKLTVRNLRVEDFIDAPGVTVFDDNGEMISTPLDGARRPH